MLRGCDSAGRIGRGAGLLLAMAGRVTAGDDNQSSGLLGRLFRIGGSPAVGAVARGGAPGASAGSRCPTAHHPAPPRCRRGRGSSTAMPCRPAGVVGASTPCPPSADSPRPRGGGRERAGGSADPQVPGELRGHECRSGAHSVRPGPVERRQQLRHVPPDLRRRHRRRFRGRPPCPAGGSEADHGAVQSGELYRLRGHCGAPSTDFIEYVHIVAYERAWGGCRPIRSRIRAIRRDATMSSATCTRRSRISRPS